MTKIWREKYKIYNKIDGRQPFIIDQVALAVPVSYLERSFKKKYKKRETITLSDSGKEKLVHFHDVLIKYDQDILTSIFMAIQENKYDDYPLFKKEVSYDDILSSFKLRVIEFAFDLHIPFMPLYVNWNTRSMIIKYFKNKPPTIYSADYYKSFKENGDADKVFESLICYYLRSHKLSKAKTCRKVLKEWINGKLYRKNIFRFEYRLKGRYLNKLTIDDLKMSPMGLSRKVKPILIKLTKKVLMPNSIWPINAEFVKILHPYLYNILLKSDQVSLKSFKEDNLLYLLKSWRAYKYSSVQSH